MDEHTLHIPEQDVRRLLAAASGEAALLYLYLNTGGAPSAAAETLRFSQRQLDFASATLRQMGLYPEPQAQHLMPSDAPCYTEADLTREYTSNPEFTAMVGDVQRRMGRVLSTEELKILLCLYRYLGLPTDVISILINYCIEKGRARGVSRLPSLRMIEKEAYRWADMGIDTMEEAAVYMQNQLQLQSRVGAVQHALQLGERRLTSGEEKLIRTWLAWGFGVDEIRFAYEKTCMNTGALKWPYLNSILKSWYEQGLITLRQIEAGDHAPARPQPRGNGGGAIRHDDKLTDFERRAVEKMLNKQFDEEG